VDLHSRLSSIARGDGAWTPPEPIPAATIVLSRGGEVLLLRRVATMAFAPRMYVFPGGRLEEVDLAAEDPLPACAIREAREEVGIEVLGGARLIDHWITPEFESRRFDVRFFHAEVADPGELATTEADELLWITPMRARAAHDEGRLPMLRPTVEVLALIERIVAGETVRQVTPKLPRPRDAQGVLMWDIVHADTGDVLARDIMGPGYAEVEGVAVR
jgi:8-oxo-dGTP pyrophosphatase MutT (NUDIX family)